MCHWKLSKVWSLLPKPKNVQLKFCGLALTKLVLLVATLTLSCAVFAKKSDYRDWKVDVVFYNASELQTDVEVAGKIRDWVDAAEDFYQRRPALKINYKIEKIANRGGRSLANLNFKSAGEYAKYMDDHFDNVAVNKTEGHMTVLIVDTFCIGTYKSGPRKGQKKCPQAKAYFPHWVVPASKKRGIITKATTDDYVYAHELGHVFGLKHTFEPYVGLNLQCNKAYKPKGDPDGKCNSCTPGDVVYDSEGNPIRCKGRANVMDYCSSDINEEYLNTCQQERAASQREIYMTADGDTNYFKLKGLAGEPICNADTDCELGSYCDKGTLTVGRNQCLSLKNNSQACTRGAQCTSGRCNALKCAEAHECTTDSQCGANQFCDKGGALGIGKNSCVDIKEPTCKGGWRYEVRNPLNKDRCNKDVVQTAQLKCRLLVTDKAKNWTGPHAQTGADECRSKKGKKPKGVKCPTGFSLKVKSGADSCSKTRTEHETPACASGFDYKSLNGKDQCRRK